MIILVSLLVTLSIISCARKYNQTKQVYHFRQCKTFRNYIISKSDMGSYTIIHYMCKGLMYSYIHKNDDTISYTETPEITNQKRADSHIVFATFTSDSNDNMQIVTKKVRKFAGMDASFYNWDKAPLYIKKKVLKAPREATGIRYVLGNGEQKTISLIDTKSKDE